MEERRQFLWDKFEQAMSPENSSTTVINFNCSIVDEFDRISMCVKAYQHCYGFTKTEWDNVSRIKKTVPEATSAGYAILFLFIRLSAV